MKSIARWRRRLIVVLVTRAVRLTLPHLQSPTSRIRGAINHYYLIICFCESEQRSAGLSRPVWTAWARRQTDDLLI